MVVGESTRLGVRVLGDLAVAGSGARPLGGPTQRRAFAVLVAHRNETTTIDQLVDACWPDGDIPRRAEHNVRTYVHRLRGAFGEHDGRIETAANGYRIRLEPADTDIDRFAQLAGEAGRLIDVGEPVAALDRLDEAESLWRGRPYAEFAEEPWVEAEVARLDDLHRTIAEQRADALLAAGHPADAVAVLERLVRDEPYRERPRALLMRALSESGRPTEALRAFQDFRRFLIDDAGVEPSPDLVELDRRIASGTLDRSTPARHVGNYELHERIGEGAFAVVHRATQTSLGREVAVKIVRAELANRPEFIRRFEAEAQMVAAIEHPNVVPLYDYWREPGNAYLVMRWMTGGSLERRLDDGPWSLDATLDLVDQIAAALGAAHARDVVHRDVKPANILFDDAGRALLGDFGIALAADERSTPQAALSEGSPIYASPEQLRREPVGPEADVHALAIVAFTLLAGHTPFADAPDEAARLRHQLHDPIPPISALRRDVPAAVAAVIATATAKRPRDRFPVVSQFAMALRAAVETHDARPAPARPPSVRTNPYRGLRPFTEADADVFHGRGRLVGELVDHLRRADHPLLVLVGPSGSGKSSVVRAGLIPALRADAIKGSSSWFTTTMIPGTHPFEALETALLRVATNPPPMLIDQLRDGDRGMLRGIRRILPDDDSVLALVVDQLEELFTATAPGDRERFLRSLTAALTEPGTPLRVVATLRADFYDQPLRHGTFAPLVKQHTIPITPLAPDELEVAITAPAADVGVVFEPGLIAEIVADVNSQPGALPLLQYALTRTFDVADGDRISIDRYREVGGLTGALTGRAEALHDDASPAERVALRRVLGRLVQLGEGTEDTRRRVRRSELPADEATHAMIERFGAARLLTFDHDPATREPTVEIAHEALLREWPRLREWLDDDRDALRTHRHLTAAAAGWAERKRDPNELYRGARLDAAEPLLDDDVVTLNEQEAAFLLAGVERRDAERDAERRRVQRLRRLVVATAVVAAVAIAAGSIAAWQQRRADRQAARAEAAALTAESARTDAEREAAAAESARSEAESARSEADVQAARATDEALAAESARAASDVDRVRAAAFEVRDTNPALAMLLAVEAHSLSPSVATLGAIHRLLVDTRGVDSAIGRQAVGRLWLDEEGTTAATQSATSIDIWDLRSQQLLGSVPRPIHIGSRVDVSFAFDIVAITDEGGIDIIDPTHDVAGTIPGTATDVAVSSASPRLALARADGVEMWDVSDPSRPALDDVTPLDAAPVVVTWMPTGDHLLVMREDWVLELRSADGLVWSTDLAPSDRDMQVIPQRTLVLPASDGHTVAVFRFDDLRVTEAAPGGGPAAHLLAIDAATGTITQRIGVPQGVLGIGWIDDRERVLAASVYRSQILAFDLTTGDEVEPPFESVATWAVGYSRALDRIVEAGTTGLTLRTADRSPLEIDLPFSEQQTTDPDLLDTWSAVVGDRVLLSGFDFQLPFEPVVEYDLTTDPPTANASGLHGLVTGSNGHILLVNESVVLLDDDLRPVGSPVPTPGDLFSFTPSPGGRFFVLTHERSGEIDLYAASGELLAKLTIPGRSEFANAIATFSPDDEQLLAFHSVGNSAWAVWDTATVDLVHTGNPNEIIRPMWAGDVLIGERPTRDYVQEVLDPDTFEPTGLTFVGHTAGRCSAAASPDGRLLATGADDLTARVWDLTTGEQIGAPLQAEECNVAWVDDTTLLMDDGNGASLWNFDTSTWPDISCRLAGRNMTRDEWERFGPRTIDYRSTCEQYPIEP